VRIFNRVVTQLHGIPFRWSNVEIPDENNGDVRTHRRCGRGKRPQRAVCVRDVTRWLTLVFGPEGTSAPNPGCQPGATCVPEPWNGDSSQRRSFRIAVAVSRLDNFVSFPFRGLTPTATCFGRFAAWVSAHGYVHHPHRGLAFRLRTYAAGSIRSLADLPITGIIAAKIISPCRPMNTNNASRRPSVKP